MQVSTEGRHHACAREEGGLCTDNNLQKPVGSRSLDCGSGVRRTPPQVLLLANAEFLDYVLVALGIVRLEVIEQATTLAHHHQETAAGGVILIVRLEVVRQLTDSFTEHRDLDLGTSRILVVCAVPGNDVLFLLSS
jgi:hypothetical protein